MEQKLVFAKYVRECLMYAEKARIRDITGFLRFLQGNSAKAVPEKYGFDVNQQILLTCGVQDDHIHLEEIHEFGATIFIVGSIPGVTQTLPLAIYEYASSPSSENMALSHCLVSVIISLSVLFLHELLQKNDLEDLT